MPLRVATDPAYRGRGIFGKLQAANEERVRELGRAPAADGAERRLGAGVPDAPRLDAAAAAAGVGAAEAAAAAGRGRAGSSASTPTGRVTWGGGDRVLRDARVAELALRVSRRARTRSWTGDGYAAVGRRGRLGVVAAVDGRPARTTSAAVAQRPRARRGAAAVGDAALRARGLRPDAAHLHGARQVARPSGPRAARTSSSATSTSSDVAYRSLVFVTQQVDPEHPVLAATVPKIRALAERLDEVVVLADRAVPRRACRPTAAC